MSPLRKVFFSVSCVLLLFFNLLLGSSRTWDPPFSVTEVVLEERGDFDVVRPSFSYLLKRHPWCRRAQTGEAECRVVRI